MTNYDLIIGEYEPNDDECDWPSDEEDEELAEDMKDKAKLEDEKTKKEEEEKDMKGVPEFWLTIFKNVDMLQEMVQEADEPVLKKLQDITVTFSENPMVKISRQNSLIFTKKNLFSVKSQCLFWI